MSDPNANRIGGARGPDGRTLTDVFNQLVTLNTAIVGVNTTLTTLLTRITYLTGTAAPSVTQFGSTGLPTFLANVVGPRNGSTPAENSLYVQMATMVSSLGGILGALAGNDVYTVGDNVLDLQLARLNSILTSYTGEAAARTTARTNIAATEDAITALNTLMQGETASRSTNGFNIGSIQAVLGSLGTAPANMTIKELIELIRAEAKRQADCCEDAAGENGGGGLPPGQNDEPTDLCVLDAEGERSSGWLERGTTTIGGTGYSVFVPVFSAIPTGTVEVVTNQGTLNNNGFRQTGAARFDLVIQWDFTGNDVAPERFTFASAFAGASLFDNNWYADTAVTAGDMIRGCYSIDIDACALGAEDAEEYYIAFAFPDGTILAEIAANAWVRQVTGSCGS